MVDPGKGGHARLGEQPRGGLPAPEEEGQDLGGTTKTTIEFPTSLLHHAKVSATREHLSLRMWMTALVAERLEALETGQVDRHWPKVYQLGEEQNPLLGKLLDVLSASMPRPVAARLLAGIAHRHGRSLATLYPTAWTKEVRADLRQAIDYYSGTLEAEHLLRSVEALLARSP